MDFNDWWREQKKSNAWPFSLLGFHNVPEWIVEGWALDGAFVILSGSLAWGMGLMVVVAYVAYRLRGWGRWHNAHTDNS